MSREIEDVEFLVEHINEGILSNIASKLKLKNPFGNDPEKNINRLWKSYKKAEKEYGLEDEYRSVLRWLKTVDGMSLDQAQLRTLGNKAEIENWKHPVDEQVFRKFMRAIETAHVLGDIDEDKFENFANAFEIYLEQSGEDRTLDALKNFSRLIPGVKVEKHFDEASKVFADPDDITQKNKVKSYFARLLPLAAADFNAPPGQSQSGTNTGSGSSSRTSQPRPSAPPSTSGGSGGPQSGGAGTGGASGSSGTPSSGNANPQQQLKDLLKQNPNLLGSLAHDPDIARQILQIAGRFRSP